MKKWNPIYKDEGVINFVNERYIPFINFWPRKSAENRDSIIFSLVWDLIRREKEVDHYKGLVREIWDAYINLMKNNPMTEEEQKGYGNYEKRLFDIFWKEVGDVLDKQHHIKYED